LAKALIHLVLEIEESLPRRTYVNSVKEFPSLLPQINRF